MRSHVLLWLAAAVLLAMSAFGCHRSGSPKPPIAQPGAGASQDSMGRTDRIRASLEQAEAARRSDQAAADSIRSAAEARGLLTLSIYFDFDRSDIGPGSRLLLERKAALLAANPRIRIRIHGNADERGADEYNLALGMRRAAATKRLLTNLGVDSVRVETASNGEEQPVCMEHDETCWRQNRRADFTITAGEVIIVNRQ
jgi:peptidoglycan-associated lipoprotein